MTKLSHGQLHDRIDRIERRLERRRARLLENTREATGAAGRAATRVLPVAAALGAGLLALWFTKRRQRAVHRAYRPHYGDAGTRRGVRWASIAGLLGSAFRIGTSPQVRALFDGYRRGRARRHG